MCGIGGLVYTRGTFPQPQTVLDRMAAALRHRGPDGAHFARLPHADLVHTRLSIIDLAGGDQPLSAGTGTLIANGEIYNDPRSASRSGKAISKPAVTVNPPPVMGTQRHGLRPWPARDVRHCTV